MNGTIDSLFRYLPLRISRGVHSLPEEIFSSVNEIRLRKGGPVSLTVGDKNLFFDSAGRVCGIKNAVFATDAEVDECISRLTRGSLYTCDEFISRGYIPLAEGGRAGVCGRANPLGGFAEITSVNLRLHRFLPLVAAGLIKKFADCGLGGALVCSPPAMGKTTFLRSAAYMLANGKGIEPKRVGIADERFEITAGMPQSGLADAVVALPKERAISLLTRTMSPQIIICDEISPAETEVILEAQHTGVQLIASAHCENPSDLLHRGRMREMLTSGIFRYFAILGYDGGYTCTIKESVEGL